MLSREEREEIEAEIGQLPQRQAACVEALKVVQRHRGWVSDEGLWDVADYLEMTTDELDAVATFYNLIFREPVGRHVILICDSVSCYVMGYEQMLAHLKERLRIRLGGTSADGRFTLLPIPCLGICDHAPVMMVDAELHVDLTPEKIDRILEQYP